MSEPVQIHNRFDPSHTRVVVGMSGGVDSSVTAALLVEQGFDVIGITIKTYNYDDVGGNVANESSCCSLDGINDAREICQDLGIPHYVVDFSSEFREMVIQPFIDEYLAGNTPNPCVICNRKIKWEALILRGLDIGADAVAMGHYAVVRQDSATGRSWISRGRDGGKDQSYALWAVSQDSLRRTILPLGNMTKAEVREHGRRLGVRTAAKGDSYEICFIPDNDYSRFLREQVAGLEDRVRNGEVWFEGKIVGSHLGYPFYTIGQRRGFDANLGEPAYVRDIDPHSNRIIVGRKEDLLSTACSVRQVNMQKYALPAAPMKVTAKIRYKDAGAPALLVPQDDGSMHLVFDNPRPAVTRGQSTVWYEGDDLVGGGVIDKVLD